MDLPTRIGRTFPTNFKYILKPFQLKNNKVTVEGISRAEYIHGKLLRSSKTKIIKKNPDPISNTNDIPPVYSDKKDTV